jgi:hypothetical protein
MSANAAAAKKGLKKLKLWKFFQVIKGQEIASKWRGMVFVPSAKSGLRRLSRGIQLMQVVGWDEVERPGVEGRE